MKAFCAAASLFLPVLVFAQLDTVWLRSFDGGGCQEDMFSDVFVDDSGNVYIAGTAWTSGSGTDIVVEKLSAEGAVVFSARYDGRAHLDDSAAAMAVV